MIHFDCRLALKDFTLNLAFEAGGGITALFGASGSGKSTVIRLLAGLARPDEGRIQLREHVLVDHARGVFVPPHQRRIGLVFQDAQLLPHLSVRQNLRYGLFFTPRRERRIELEAVIEVLGIDHILQRSPTNLSGGERQRVAIGRALLTSPRLLLMDEPLASLDHARKAEILPFIERMRDEFDVPIVYVSHSAEEVARLATDVVVIDNGRRLAQGSPAVVLPLKTTGTGLGAGELTSRISATVGAYLPHYGITLLAHPAGAIALPGSFEANAHPLRLLIQESAVRLHPARLAASAIPNTLRGTLITIEPLDGAFIRAVMALEGGDTLSVRTTRYMLDQLALRTGDDVWAIVDAAAVERGAHPQP